MLLSKTHIFNFKNFQGRKLKKNILLITHLSRVTMLAMGNFDRSNISFFQRERGLASMLTLFSLASRQFVFIIIVYNYNLINAPSMNKFVYLTHLEFLILVVAKSAMFTNMPYTSIFLHYFYLFFVLK